MRRCGRDELHQAHDDCDGRTTNAPLVGVCTVRELQAFLEHEQGNAVLAVAVDGVRYPLRTPATSQGTPVVHLDMWEGE